MTFKRSFWILTALFVPTLIALVRIDSELHAVHAPHGIVSFEFCGLTQSCPTILNEWGAEGREWAMLSLGLDFLFMLSYAAILWTGLMWASASLSSQARARVGWIAAGAIVAGLADAAENYLLIKIVMGGEVSIHGELAATFASLKFALVLIALLVWVSLGVRRVAIGRS